MCLGPEASSTAASLAKRKRPAVFNRRPTMLPPPLSSASSSSSPRSRLHQVEDDGPHVTFQESQDQVHEFTTVLSCLGGGEEQRRQLWYNKADIREFRREASSLSKQLREQQSSQESSDDESTTRGLELRSSLERQQRKHLIVRRVLEAQEEDCEAAELAQISKQHSLLAQKLAQAQAHKDYYAVYHPNLTSVLVPQMPAMLDCHRDLVANANKRSSMMNSFEQRGRRVRCRMF